MHKLHWQRILILNRQRIALFDMSFFFFKCYVFLNDIFIISVSLNQLIVENVCLRFNQKSLPTVVTKIFMNGIFRPSVICGLRCHVAF